MSSVLPPWPVGPSSPAYRIAGGQVEVITLPEHPAVYELTGLRATDSAGDPYPVHLLPGREDAHYRTHALPLIADIAIRITPWAKWYFAPGFTGCQHDGEWYGRAWGEQEVVVCITTRPPPALVEIALHESWHLCESLMTASALRDLDAQLSTGADWPGDCYPKPCERRARAFAHFGMMMTEGCQMVIAGPHAPAQIQLFWAIYNGDFGTEIMRRRTPKPPQKGLLRRLVDAI